MRHKDLIPVDHLRKRDGAVLFPVLHRFGVLDEDDEVIGLALEENLGYSDVAAWHDDG